MNDALCAGLKESGTATEPTENPVPLTATELIVTVDPPELVTFTVWLVVVDVVTEPKFTLVGFGDNWPCVTPVPVTEIDAVELFAKPLFVLFEAVIDTDPEVVPVAVGAKTIEKASVCPAAKKFDLDRPDTVNPCGVVIWVIVTDVLPWFVMVAGCVTAEPTSTFPKPMEPGLAEICTAEAGYEDPAAACKPMEDAAMNITIIVKKREAATLRRPKSFIREPQRKLGDSLGPDAMRPFSPWSPHHRDTVQLIGILSGVRCEQQMSQGK